MPEHYKIFVSIVNNKVIVNFIDTRVQEGSAPLVEDSSLHTPKVVHIQINDEVVHQTAAPRLYRDSCRLIRCGLWIGD